MRDVYEPWQRGYTDAREGVHRTVNRLVAIGDEVASECGYVRGKFMPQTIDITETDLVWYVPSGEAPEDLYIGTATVASRYTAAATIDTLLDGIYDAFEVYAEHPLSLTFTDMTGHVYPYVYGLSDTAVYRYDISTDAVDACIETTRARTSFVAYVDMTATVIILPNDVDIATVEIRNSAGDRVLFETLTPDTARGSYMPLFDRDHDGIIWNADRATIDAVRGKSQADLTPQEWADVEDLDHNHNLRIDDDDLRPFDNAYHSIADTLHGAVRILGNQVGRMTVSYYVERPGIIALDDGETFVPRYAADPISSFGSSIWYDDILDVYFAVKDDQFLHVIKRGALDSASNDHRIHLPLWNTSARLLDVLVWNGYLWVLATDGATHKLFMADVYREQVFTIDREYTLPITWKPTAFTVLHTGRMIIAGAKKLIELQPKRYSSYRTNGITYLTNKETLTTKAGVPVQLLPQRVFNSFDAFAYNLGLTRSYGRTNEEVRELIYNAGRYPNGHTAAKMRNVILRELGYLAIQDDVYPYVTLANPLDVTKPVYVNGLQAHCVTENGTTTITAGSALFTLRFSRILERRAPTDSATYVFDGYWIDGDTRSRRLSDVKVSFDDAYVDDRVVVRSFTDADYLTDNGYMLQNAPTDTLRSFMLTMDRQHPALVSNCVINAWPFDFIRTPSVPLLPTGYNPAINISEDEQLTI